MQDVPVKALSLRHRNIVTRRPSPTAIPNRAAHLAETEPGRGSKS